MYIKIFLHHSFIGYQGAIYVYGKTEIYQVFPIQKNKPFWTFDDVYSFLISASYLEFVETNTGVMIDPWRNKIIFRKVNKMLQNHCIIILARGHLQFLHLRNRHRHPFREFLLMFGVSQALVLKYIWLNRVLVFYEKLFNGWLDIIFKISFMLNLFCRQSN